MLIGVAVFIVDLSVHRNLVRGTMPTTTTSAPGPAADVVPSRSQLETQVEKELTGRYANATQHGGTAERGWHATALMSPNSLALIILITAILARIYIYWRAPSLSGDEISVSMNVITHPLLGLAHKLDFQQFAPLGFIWMQRLIVDLAGVSERAFRLFPLIAGCLSVVAVWDMSRRFLDRYGALIAAALIGFAPFAVVYSAVAKQYGVELFVTAMLLWLRSYSGDMPRKPTIQAGVIATGVVACLFSIPAVFVLAGLWASYAAVALRAEIRRGDLLFVGIAGFIWCAAFGVIYVTLLAPHTEPFLFEWWRPSDLSLHLRDVNLGSLIAHGFLDPVLSINSRIPMPVFVAGCICLILGVYAMAKLRGSHVALLFVTPLVLCLAAALVGKWFLSPRLMLWTAPLCAVLIAATICWIATLVGRFSTQIQLIAAVAILAFPLKGTAYWVRHPPLHDDLRAAVEFSQRVMQPGDVVYVFAHAMPGWMFYSTNWAKPDRARYNWLKHATDEVGPQFGDIPHRGHRVVQEGLELLRPYREGVELAGIAEGGFTNSQSLGVGSLDPTDPGWSDNEVRRILATHGRRIVLLASSVRDRTVSVLLDCLRSNGGAVIDEFRSESARAVVVEMRGSGPVVPCVD